MLLKLINWEKCRNYLKNVHKNDINPQGGQKAYDNLKMFKTLLLQQWHSLSDEQTEEALSVRIDFMLFTGFELNDEIPDACTICRFRNKLTILSNEAIQGPAHAPDILPPWVAEQGTRVILSGGMGGRAQELFAEQGIKVIAGCPSEDPEKVVIDYLNGTLTTGVNGCDHSHCGSH